MKWRSSRNSVGPSCTGLPVAADPVRFDVHLDIGVGELLAGERGPHPAEDGADARQQLARAERLGHIIVGAGLEAANAVALLAARGQHDDRHVRGRCAAPQPPANLDPADALDHPVEDDEVRRALFGEDQRFVAVGGADDVITLAVEMPDEQVGKRAVVLDQQERRLGHGDDRPSRGS